MLLSLLTATDEQRAGPGHGGFTLVEDRLRHAGLSPVMNHLRTHYHHFHPSRSQDIDGEPRRLPAGTDHLTFERAGQETPDDPAEQGVTPCALGYRVGAITPVEVIEVRVSVVKPVASHR
ncbi:hypothetical protein EB72_17970 [Mycobacterium sp. SWH-M1]|nr:hypothetical protein EB72_17970 [Mycobacterium sp. SWH-M1]